ncbi:hypothetical protein MNBD_GAMMA25-1033 [hydrothermal vent metagenome]|uniref:DUF2288 domain-containing protein n=1 Tax=hydrothermal vent metagenome TaxID=652676 RepID=A0A3B1B5S5_9ZZZZ
MTIESSQNKALSTDELRNKLNLESGHIDWQELQRHFARGVVIAVEAELDLLEVAIKFTLDDKSQIESWINTGTLKRADDSNALHWEQTKTIFWAIVVAPWILVQDKPTSTEQTER